MAKRPPADKFPLWLHPTGQWAKKIRGKFFYFGTDRVAALKKYVEERDDLKAGRVRRAKADRVGLAYLVNMFLSAKRQRVESGELTGVMWSEYHKTCETLVTTFGRERDVADLKAADFGALRAKAAQRLGPFALSKFIQMVRTVFIYGYKSELLAVPIRYGDEFDKPPRRILRLERKKGAARLLEPAEVWKLLAEAGPQLKAMILLGLNAGFGQKDAADLQVEALDSRPGWLAVARQKTGVDRVCRLWPETAAALAAARADRPAPLDPADAGCVFVTTFGRRWVRYLDRGVDKRGVRTDAVGLEFKKLAKKAGVAVPGGFYVLRHTFQTIAEGAKDPVAVATVMGHVDDSMSAVYRERVENARIEAVTNHVRAWLLAGKPEGGGSGQTQQPTDLVSPDAIGHP